MRKEPLRKCLATNEKLAKKELLDKFCTAWGFKYFIICIAYGKNGNNIKRNIIDKETVFFVCRDK